MSKHYWRHLVIIFSSSFIPFFSYSKSSFPFPTLLYYFEMYTKCISKILVPIYVFVDRQHFEEHVHTYVPTSRLFAKNYMWCLCAQILYYVHIKIRPATRIRKQNSALNEKLCSVSWVRGFVTSGENYFWAEIPMSGSMLGQRTSHISRARGQIPPVSVITFCTY